MCPKPVQINGDASSVVFYEQLGESANCRAGWLRDKPPTECSQLISSLQLQTWCVRSGSASSAHVCLCAGASASYCLVRLHGSGSASSAHVCLCAGAAASCCLVRLHGSGPASSASVPAPVPVPAHPLCGQGQHGGRRPCSTNPSEYMLQLSQA